MKKILIILLSVFLLFAVTVGCTSGEEAAPSTAPAATPQPSEEPDAGDVKKENEQQEQNLESNDLVKAAQAEGKVVVYSITSRITNAAEKFEQKYGIPVEAYNLKDFELIEKVSQESRSGIANADLVLAQESGRVLGELIEPGYLENYVPDSMKDVIPADFQNPLVFSFITKVFAYNSETYHFPPVNNIWELTEPKWKGKSYFKDPFQEGVNASFLTMLTSTEVSKKIEEAYEKHYGKKLELTTENAGYEWIKAFFQNDVVLFNSDTRVNEAIGVKGNQIDAVGLYVYSKLRERETKDLAVMPIMSMEPFAGFYYPSLLLMVKDAKHPNAAKLFIEFLLTSEGFSPWNDGIGTYSSNPNIPVTAGDNSFSVWEQILVGEDPEFTFNHRSKVEDFLNSIMY